MAPKARCDKIRVLKRRLRYESSGDEKTPALHGSLKEHNVDPDPKAARPQTRVATGAGQTQALVVCTPQSDERGNERSDSIQITPSIEESNSASRSLDTSERESSIVPRSSLSPPDALTSR